MKKGYIKRGNIIVTMTGDVCCTKEDCPHIDDMGICRNINAKCEYEKQRYYIMDLQMISQSLWNLDIRISRFLSQKSKI